MPFFGKCIQIVYLKNKYAGAHLESWKYTKIGQKCSLSQINTFPGNCLFIHSIYSNDVRPLEVIFIIGYIFKDHMDKPQDLLLIYIIYMYIIYIYFNLFAAIRRR